MKNKLSAFEKTRVLATVSFLAIAVADCGSGGGPFEIGPAEDDVVSTVLVLELDPQVWPGDPFQLRDAAIVGDTLRMDVEYGGGCEEHAFGFVVATLFRESQPVQTSALLAHDDMDDHCDALIRRVLKADLTPLKRGWQGAYQAQSGTIVIELAGTSTLVYAF